jgi:hypothetical protein
VSHPRETVTRSLYLADPADSPSPNLDSPGAILTGVRLAPVKRASAAGRPRRVLRSNNLVVSRESVGRFRGVVTMKTLTAALLAGASLLIASTSFAADRVKAGKWETKLTPPGASAPIVSTYCISADEARLMNSDVATLRKYVTDSTAAKLKGRCTVKSVVAKDNQTIVTIACGKTEVTSTTTYYGDHYDSTSSNGTKLSGKRIGDCSK